MGQGIKFINKCRTGISIRGSKGKGAPGTRAPASWSNFFIFMQFLVKILPNNRFFNKLKGLKNPRSVTENNVVLIFFLKIFSEISRMMSHAGQQRGCQGNICFDCATDLLVATGSGLHVCVEALVKAGADVNSNDTEAPLMKAAGDGCSQCVETLIATGADVNGTDGNVPLIKAATKGHCKCIEILLAAGADVNKQDRHGNTATIEASHEGQYQAIETLIKAGAHVNKQSMNGQTALIFAEHSGFHKCIEALIQTGANVNTKNYMRSTPLHEAAFKGHDKCVDVLVKSGADVNLRPLFHTPLTLAAQEGHCKCLKILLQSGADSNIPYDLHGETALVLAARSGNLQCTKILLHAGADVNVLDYAGKPVLHTLLHPKFYTIRPRAQCLRFLLAAGASVNINNKGKTTDQNRVVRSDGKQQYLSQMAFNSGDKELREVLNEMRGRESELCLSHLCREAIRKHLLQMNKTNLFCTVSRLGLPASLTSYLLYDTTLEDAEEI